MVDFKNPVVIEKDFHALVKLFHFFGGIFIWEFLITLNYEWSIIRGHRPRRWTIWIYSLTRVCTLNAVILNMLGFDSPRPINCQLWVTITLISYSLAFAATSLLIVLRIIAIWNRNRIAVAIAMCVWSTDVAFLIYNMAQLHSVWEPAQRACIILNTEGSKKTVIVVHASGFILPITMLVGLLRMHLHGSTLGLGQLLWNQGLIRLFLAGVAGPITVALISLNLNGPLNIMFQAPAVVALSIAGTRTYRSLTDFTNPEYYASRPPSALPSR